MAVKDLKHKVEELVDMHRHALDENSALKSQNAELRNRINEQEKEIERLTESYKVMKLSEGVRSKGDTRETNLKINELVREIDKCIAQLNR